jgi:hypothetical protein
LYRSGCQHRGLWQLRQIDRLEHNFNRLPDGGGLPGERGLPRDGYPKTKGPAQNGPHAYAAGNNQQRRKQVDHHLAPCRQHLLRNIWLSACRRYNLCPLVGFVTYARFLGKPALDCAWST